MNLEDRVAAEGIFKNETEILVATEAAGEGINLQFCHMMINFDFPGTPTGSSSGWVVSTGTGRKRRSS